MLKLRNTFFCVVTFILPKDLNSSIILRQLTRTFKNLSGEDKVSFMLHGSKTNTSANFNLNIIKTVIKYLKNTGGYDNSLL